MTELIEDEGLRAAKLLDAQAKAEESFAAVSERGLVVAAEPRSRPAMRYGIWRRSCLAGPGNNDVTRPQPQRIDGTADSTAQLFSYGTLQEPNVQLSSLGRLLDGTLDVLPGYRTEWVAITDPAVLAASGADLHPVVVPSDIAGDVVFGTIFIVTTAELAAADTYEVDDYRRDVVILASGHHASVYLRRAIRHDQYVTDTTMRDFLRALAVFDTPLPKFHTDKVPDDPHALFARWMEEAVAAGELEPHAATLSTVDAAGTPDARILILKDLNDRGWWFASSNLSAKGRQLAVNPVAALNFHWKTLGRQIRVRGHVTVATTAECASDFRARSVGARAVALASKESEPLASAIEFTEAVAAAHQLLVADPDRTAEHWTLYILNGEQIEFWQADRERQHERIRYDRHEGSWSLRLLWP